MVDQEIGIGLYGRVEAALRVLSPREQQVLRLRFGLGERSHDHTEIGRQFGVTRSSIRTIEFRAFQRLRQAALLEFSDVEAEAANRGPVPGSVPRPLPAKPTPPKRVERPSSLPPPEPYQQNDPYPVNSVGWDEV